MIGYFILSKLVPTNPSKMSSQVKNLVRCLQAVGSTAKGDGGLCLLSQSGSRLIENIYSGEELDEQRTVAEDVKENTSAVYIVLEDKTLIVYIGDTNTLRCSEFNADQEEWVEVDDQEGLKDVKVHPKSRLGGALLPDGAIVFFQNEQGKVSSVRYKAESKTWVEGGPVPAAAKVGTPLAVFSSNVSMFVSYVDNDGSAHCHGRDFQTGDWKDHVLSSERFKGSVESLVVTQDAETAKFEAYILAEGSVVQVKKDGTKSVLGTVKGKDFTPATKAESAVWIGGNNYGNISIYNSNYNYNYNYSYSGGGGYGYCRPVYTCRPCW